jgi:hypothetical protein
MWAQSIGWRMDDVVPADEIVARIDAELPLEPIGRNYHGEVARRYRYRDGSGESTSSRRRWRSSSVVPSRCQRIEVKPLASGSR